MASNIYILPYYANKENLKENRFATTREYKITYNNKKIKVDLSEINSLIEDRYCLNLSSYKFELMIHHHEQGHQDKHLQFRLKSKNEVLRIIMPFLEQSDYERCIKGFLYLTQNILNLEKEENKIEIDLHKHFFNEKINELEGDKMFLLRNIKQSYESQNILDQNSVPINLTKLESLKLENHLIPFFEW